MHAFNSFLFHLPGTSLFVPSLLKAVFAQYRILELQGFHFSFVFFHPFKIFSPLCYGLYCSDHKSSVIFTIFPVCNVLFLLAALKTLLSLVLSSLIDVLKCGFEKWVAIISSNIFFCSISHSSPSETPIT